MKSSTYGASSMISSERFGGEGRGVAAGISQPLIERRRRFRKLLQEDGVDSRQAFMLVEILKGKSKRQGQLIHSIHG